MHMTGNEYNVTLNMLLISRTIFIVLGNLVLKKPNPSTWLRVAFLRVRRDIALIDLS